MKTKSLAIRAVAATAGLLIFLVSLFTLWVAYNSDVNNNTVSTPSIVNVAKDMSSVLAGVGVSILISQIVFSFSPAAAMAYKVYVVAIVTIFAVISVLAVVHIKTIETDIVTKYIDVGEYMALFLIGLAVGSLIIFLLEFGVSYYSKRSSTKKQVLQISTVVYVLILGLSSVLLASLYPNINTTNTAATYLGWVALGFTALLFIAAVLV